MFKNLVFLMVAILFSGCGSKINQEVNSYESDIYSAKYSITKSKTFLRNNTDVYVNGECILPDRSSPPDPFCPNLEESKRNAVAYCSAPLGCDVAMLLSDNLDSFEKKFLASEACSHMVNEIRGSNYSTDDTTINLLEAGSDEACNQNVDGFWSGLGKMVGCGMSVSIKLSKINAYSNCVNERSNKCHKRYLEWKEEPYKRKNLCKSNLRNIKSKKEKLDRLYLKLSESKDTFAWKLFGED